jgi:hypothetical protein
MMVVVVFLSLLHVAGPRGAFTPRCHHFLSSVSTVAQLLAAFTAQQSYMWLGLAGIAADSGFSQAENEPELLRH